MEEKKKINKATLVLSIVSGAIALVLIASMFALVYGVWL